MENRNNISGTIREINNNEIIIEVEGENKIYLNNFFNLKVDDKVKFSIEFPNVLEKVVIYD